MKRPRPIVPHPTDPTLALVELTRGRWALIDAADADWVGQLRNELHGEFANHGTKGYLQ